MAFIPGFDALFQAEQMSFGDVEILNLTDLSTGIHLFIFALDTVANGVLDGEALMYDIVTVNVNEN